MTNLKDQLKLSREEFDKEFCKVYPDGSSRFLRSIDELSDGEIKDFMTQQQKATLEAVKAELKAWADENKIQIGRWDGCYIKLEDLTKKLNQMINN